MPPGPIIALPPALVARYRAGELSARELARLADCDRETVRRRLAELGSLRPRAEVVAAQNRGRTRHAKRDAQIRRLRAQGWTWPALARRFGVSTARIGQILAAP